MSFLSLKNLRFGFLGIQLGIDLGTSNTPVFLRGAGIIFSEPSYVAMNQNTRKVIAVGEKAKQMHGRTPPHITVIRPLRDGVIANFEVAYEMLRFLVNKAVPNHYFSSLNIVLGVPSDCTPVERRAVEEAAHHAGGKNIVLAAQPFLAAIGAGMPVREAVGSMMVDIGGGTTEIAILSLGGIVSSQSLRVAGDKMDESIVNYLKKTYNLIIGERTAETIKIQLGSVFTPEEKKTLEVRGRDVFSGLPRSQTITSGDIREALLEPCSRIVEGVKSTLEHSPPELVSDIMEHGIVMAGGGAMISGFPVMVQETTKIPCRLAEDPINCVALGAGRLFEDLHFLKEVAGRGSTYWEHPVEVA
jgi:rod shape-determining protein MreB